MRKIYIIIVLAIVCVLSLVISIGIGSASISPIYILNSFFNKIFDIQLWGTIDDITESIIWKIRIPRTLLAFISGGGLAVSGVMMQSVLRNPLASSFTLGVSSGAALGASCAIIFNISIFGMLTLPIFGLVAGLITVFLSLGVASKIDRNLQNNSIILTGMAFSLFANAIITIIMALAKEQLQQIVYWQMGSFSGKEINDVLIICPILLVSYFIVMKSNRQMDIMTLGDEQALISGVDVTKMKWVLLSFSAIIAGTIVSMVGVIGFVDLFIPHAVRKIFGASHKFVLPASILLGGAFMLLCDLAARTIVAPLELPVGAITSALGAPFFIYLYFSRRTK